MRPHPNHAPRGSPAAGVPRSVVLAHYEVGLVIAAHDAPLREAGGAPTPYGLVVRHYVHQLPQKFLELELLGHRIESHALRMVLRLRLGEGSTPPPDPAAIRDGVRWLRAMSTNARHRGGLDGRWRYLEGPVWARGFARQLLRTPTELARAVQACGTAP